jgi:ATP-dependent Clp protease adaptor protein ClpS
MQFSITHTKEQQDVEVLEDIQDPFRLIVWNDDVNTFDWVIETLMEVCGHNREQAEQCAWLIHHTGKYAVKHGNYDTLRKMCDEITDRKIGATVEEAS